MRSSPAQLCAGHGSHLSSRGLGALPIQRTFDPGLGLALPFGAYVAIITLAEPIGSGILAFVLLGEMITGPAAIGAILVLAGIYVVSRDEIGLQAFTTRSTT